MTGDCEVNPLFWSKRGEYHNFRKPPFFSYWPSSFRWHGIDSNNLSYFSDVFRISGGARESVESVVRWFIPENCFWQSVYRILNLKFTPW